MRIGCNSPGCEPMEVLYLLIPIALVLVAGIVIVLCWAVQSGQFDDLDSPAHRILMDEDGDTPARRDPGDASSSHGDQN